MVDVGRPVESVWSVGRSDGWIDRWRSTTRKEGARGEGEPAKIEILESGGKLGVGRKRVKRGGKGGAGDGRLCLRISTLTGRRLSKYVRVAYSCVRGCRGKRGGTEKRSETAESRR